MKNLEKPLVKNNINRAKKESKDHHTSLKQELFIQDNGKEDSETGMENRHGQMELSTLGSGEITELMVKESLFMLMEMFMKVSGQMIRQMAMVYIDMSMELNMKGNGKMTYSMVKVLKLGLMDQNMKVIMHLEESME